MLKHPVASNFLGRFGTMYNHVTAESRCALGIAGPTKPTKPARRFFDASGTAQPSPAPDFSPDLHARARAIHPGKSERLRLLTSCDDPAGNHVGHDFALDPWRAPPSNRSWARLPRLPPLELWDSLR